MIDLLMRGGAVGTLCAISFVLLAGGVRRKGVLSIATFSILIICYLIVSGPVSATFPPHINAVLIIGATLAPVGFTWMMLDLLTDPPHIRWPWLGAATATVIAALGIPFWAIADIVRSVILIALYLGLMFLAAMSDRDDLIAARRRFRRVFLVVMALLGVAITTTEITGADAGLPYFVYSLQAATFWFLALMFAVWSLRPDNTIFQRTIPVSSARQTGRSDLIDKLTLAMSAGAWRREGLTIGMLADDLGVPEHRLRTTINRDLGLRNFSTFINGHRIDSAKQMLSDPANAQTTILEIAYDCGFASLGPFNKAFRAQSGQSPREFRSGIASILKKTD